MNANFIKKRALKLAAQPVISRTMNKINPVSKGGTKLVSMIDLQVAIIETAQTLRKTQMTVRGKQDRVWRANL